MRNKIFVLFILIFSFFFCGSYSDEYLESQIETVNEYGLFDELSDQTFSILEALGLDEISPESIASLSFLDIIKLFYESFILKIKEPFSAFGFAVAALILFTLIKSLFGDLSSYGYVINAAVSMSVSCAIFIPTKNLIEEGANVIKECSGFMLGFIPVYSAAVTSSGYVSASAGFRSLMLSAVNIVIRISNELVVPLIGIYLALCITAAVSDINIKNISKSVKNFAVWIIGITMTVFSGIMGLGTLIAGTSDSAVSKTAKFIISSTIPIVGGTVSDALLTIKNCLIITKNILGAYAIIVIAAIFLPIILSIIIWKTSLFISSCIGDLFDASNISGLFSAASDVLGIMLALVSVTAMMFIFSISIMLMTGAGL